MNKNKSIIGVTVGCFLGATGIALGQFLHETKSSESSPVSMTIAPLTPAFKAKLDEVDRLDHSAAAELDAGQYAEAETDARQSVSIYFGSGLGQELLASALNAQGKTQEALEAYKQIAVSGGVYPRNMLPYALLQLKAGHWAQAVAAYNKQLPYLADGKLLNANSHFSPDLPQSKELETAIHIALGLTYAWSGSWGRHSQADKATNEYEKAIAVDPDSALANLYYGRMLRQMGQKTQAQAAFAKAVKTGSNDVKADAAGNLENMAR